MRRVMAFTDVQIAGPVVEPLTVAEIKQQRRFASPSIDNLFAVWNEASRQDFEALTGLQLVTATREFALDGAPWEREIQLSRAPVQGIVSVTYDDPDGVAQTLDASSYTLVPRRTDGVGFEPFPALASVVLVPTAIWPITGWGPRALRVRYRAGFGDLPTDVPGLIRYALQMWIGTAHKYGEELQEMRGSNLTVPGVAQVLRHGRTRRTVYPTRGGGTTPWGTTWLD